MITPLTHEAPLLVIYHRESQGCWAEIPGLRFSAAHDDMDELRDLTRAALAELGFLYLDEHDDPELMDDTLDGVGLGN